MIGGCDCLPLPAGFCYASTTPTENMGNLLARLCVCDSIYAEKLPLSKKMKLKFSMVVLILVHTRKWRPDRV